MNSSKNMNSFKIDKIISKSFDMYLTRIEHYIRNTELVFIENYIICFEHIKTSVENTNCIIFIIIIYEENNKKIIEYKNISTGVTGYYNSTNDYYDLRIEDNFTDNEFKNKEIGFVSKNIVKYSMESKNDFIPLYKDLNKF